MYMYMHMHMYIVADQVITITHHPSPITHHPHNSRPSPLTARPSPLNPHTAHCTPHPSPLTHSPLTPHPHPHPSPLTPHPSPLTLVSHNLANSVVDLRPPSPPSRQAKHRPTALRPASSHALTKHGRHASARHGPPDGRPVGRESRGVRSSVPALPPTEVTRRFEGMRRAMSKLEGDGARRL